MLSCFVALAASTFAADIVERDLNAWPSRILAPYLYTSQWTNFDLDRVNRETGQKYFTLCFVLADKWGNPAWNGNEGMDVQYFSDTVNKIRGFGGDVIVSFGGASGTELALSTYNVNDLAAKYQAVINKYSLNYIDIDIEGHQIQDRGSIDRRSQALKIVRQNNPKLTLSYTLATSTNGLDDQVFYTIKSAQNYGLKLDVINIMAMDYGNVPNGNSAMGSYAISAAQALYNQLQGAGLYDTKVGVTPMIGQNDVQSEIFQLDDARELADWAKQKDWVKLIAFWSLNRDTAQYGDLFISTRVPQKNYEFLTTLQSWSNTAAQPAPGPSGPTPNVPSVPPSATLDVYAPYVDITSWPTFDIGSANSKVGVKFFNLGFIGCNKWSNPAWGGIVALDESFYLDNILNLRKKGGDVIVSFGGPDADELALQNNDPSSLRDKYQWVIDTYKIEWFDFNLRPNVVSNQGANDIRAKALVQLKKANPFLKIIISIPVDATGITADGVNLLKNSLANGLQYEVVNLMVVNSPASGSVGSAAVSIAKISQGQLKGIGVGSQLGITVKIGEVSSGVAFTLADAKQVLAYSEKKGTNVGLISIWTINQDKKSKNSQLIPNDFAFSSIFVQKASKLAKREVTGYPLSLKRKIFAPFCDVLLWPTLDVSDVFAEINVPWYTLAFIIADSNKNPSWGGVVPLSEEFYKDNLNELREAGGDVIVSFGGAQGRELATVETDPNDLAAKYQRVIDTYKLKWVDFDVEGAAIADTAANQRRSKAFAVLKQRNPGLIISVTLPAMEYGLENNGIALINTDIKAGGNIDLVNLMTMNFGSGHGKMGDYSIQAAKAAYQQIQDAGLKKAKIGITPMLGQNDIKGEVFDQGDAKLVLEFARRAPFVGFVSFWSINRDNGDGGELYASSQLKQADYEFAKIFSKLI